MTMEDDSIDNVNNVEEEEKKEDGLGKHEATDVSSTINEVKPEWYICRVKSGREEAIINSLKSSFILLERDGINAKDYFKDFSVLKCKSVKYNRGKKVEADNNAYQGYIFLKVKMTENISLFLQNFLYRNHGKLLLPAISEEDYKAAMRNAEANSNSKQEVAFKVGQRVKSSGIVGVITSINEAEKKITVSVKIFDCETTTTIGYNEATIIDDK